MKRFVIAMLCGCGSDNAPTSGSETDPGTTTGTLGSTSVTSDDPSSSSTSTVTTDPPDTTSASTSTDAITSDTTAAIPDVIVECDQCDLFAQDCGDGQRCVPWSCDGTPQWNGTRCSAIADDPVGIGEPCTMQDSPYSGLDDCQRSAMCWEVDEATLEGTCIGLCIGSLADPDCAESCAECLLPAEGVLALCVTSCDPVMQTCDAGDGCYLVGEAYVCAPSSAPDAMPGDACEDVTDCAPGDTCVNGAFVPGCTPGEGCCTPFCTEGDPGGCDEVPGSACAALFLPGQGPACVPDETGICVEP
jgi:hypothetical protein